jgi:hypothetical protein
MIELLALPGWNVANTPLSAWVDELRSQGLDVVVTRESADVSWIELGALRLRGYAMTVGLNVEAINFELTAPHPESDPARRAVDQAARALGWEVDEEEDGDKDGDNDD